MSKRGDKRHFLGFAIDVDLPAATSKRVPKESDAPLWAVIVAMWFSFACGYFTRYGFEKNARPTAHIEVTSKELEKGATNE